MEQVRLDGETDLAGFRAQARALLARRVPPEQVHWSTGGAGGDLFAAEPQPPTLSPAPVGAARALVPPAFLRLVETVILHSDPARFTLLYRLLWRLVHEPGLRDDPIDPDMLAAQQMAQQVRRDLHKMKAFLRFRPVPDMGCRDGVLHVAWFEPQHHIVEAVAPWCARRFTGMDWAILTPERSVRWDGTELSFGPPARREDAPAADAGEQLWLTYYRSIFNPARLKLDMMRKEMPRRYWHNLPEAALIGELSAQAMERSGQMIDAEPAAPLRRMPRVSLAPATVPTPQRITSLADLRTATRACRACPIGEHATQSVVGEGRLDAPLVFVGEQPGDQEDLQGHPFVGPAGQLLDRALQQAGIDRAAVFVTNAVKHFKYELRGKRRIHKSPTQREAAACLHWLEDELAMVRPQACVALGATAARSLLGRQVAVLKERGQWLVRADGLRVLVTLHPSALLRMPPQEQAGAFEEFVRDLALAAQVLPG
jgi:DNA polymerase